MSKIQLQVQLQQKQKRHKKKYCLDSSTNSCNTSSHDNYQHQSQCQHFLSTKDSQAATNYIPLDNSTNHHNLLNHSATTSRVEYCEHTSPSHHCKNHHYLSNSQHVTDCTKECQHCKILEQNDATVSQISKTIPSIHVKFFSHVTHCYKLASANFS